MDVKSHLKKSIHNIKLNVLSVRRAQTEAIEFSLSNTKASIQMPTGSGKSLVIRSLAYLRVMDGHTVFIIVPGYDIGDALLREFTYEVFGLNIKFHAPQRTPKLDSSSKIIITTYQTFWRRVAEYFKLFKNRKLCVIYDEAHHVNVLAPRNFAVASSFDKIYTFSASPWSPFCLYMTKNRYIYKISEAQREGVVAEPKLLRWIPSESDISISPDIWYYPSIDEALESLGLEGKNKKLKKIGVNRHESSRVGFTCSIPEYSDEDFLRRFNKNQFGRAVVINQLREGFDSNIIFKGTKIPIKRVVILSKEQSPISLYQKAGRALRPGGGIIHCSPAQADILNYAFDLADGAPIECDSCGEEHLSVHHIALSKAEYDDLPE